MTENNISISVQGISKIYNSQIGGKKIQALDSVSLSVNSGEIFGLLGPNGAGKTTLVKILLGVLNASSGLGYINDMSVTNAEARTKIGFLPENHDFPGYHTASQMLFCFGGMAGLSKKEISEKSAGLLKLVGIDQWADTKVSKFSKGMKQRLGLAQALLNDPDIIFLDEPTDGVDPVGRREIRDILRELKSQGKTIFLNSHLLAEVESVCDRVAVLNKGKLIKIGPAVGLTSSKPIYTVETDGFEDRLKTMIITENPNAKINDNTIQVAFDNNLEINRLIDLLRDNGVDIISAVPQKMSLEDSFMQLIREENNDK